MAKRQLPNDTCSELGRMSLLYWPAPDRTRPNCAGRVKAWRTFRLKRVKSRSTSGIAE
ncbi:Uncharacterised protein [Bordetella pertussis]|nr:Uncharacterised protein [Bordetella pertussis]CFO79417.1 Uncharacterised protein [Bordetella pertussis]CFU86684.1 Uncharacterised protein [Bordetella pertussis]CPI60341.1 Uncharacterised protein [Bordetella pertussis]CPK98873.1 Uncharacterised protein [Bordetella pertussis]